MKPFLITHLLTCAMTASVLVTPADIEKLVNVKGAKAAVDELYSQRGSWRSVIASIESSSRKWLQVAIALKPGADAGPAEMLDNAVATALESNPVNVFIVAVPAFSIESICGPVEDDDSPNHGSYAKDTAALAKRIARVRAIVNPALAETKQKCLAQLSSASELTKKYYGVER